MAWANVFYSIKQTWYLVGKLVRTQRCDVGALRESREGKRYPLADIFKGLTSHLASAGGLNGPPIRLPLPKERVVYQTARATLGGEEV